MSKYKYIISLQQELKKLNSMIDLKILRGENYARESRRHRLVQRIIRRHKMPTLAKLFPVFFA